MNKKIVFDYIDMRCIDILRRSYDSLKKAFNKNLIHDSIPLINETIGIINLLNNKLKSKNISIQSLDSMQNLDILLKYIPSSSDLRYENFTQDTFTKYLNSLEVYLKYLITLENHKISSNDNTLNKEFYLNIYSRTSNNDLNLKLKKHESGWYFFNETTNNWVTCNKYCDSKLFLYLDNFAINYPNDLRGYLKWLWEASTVYNLTEIEVEEEFNELSKWINLCNSLSPKTKLGGYK